MGNPSFVNHFEFVKCCPCLDYLLKFCPAELTSWRLEPTQLSSVHISAPSLSSPESPLSPCGLWGSLRVETPLKRHVLCAWRTANPNECSFCYCPSYLPLKSAQDCTIQRSIPLTVQMDSFIWLNFHKRVQGKKLKYKNLGWRDVSAVEWAFLPGVQFPACTVGGTQLLVTPAPGGT